MLEVKGILDIDKDDGPFPVADQEEPMLNAKLIQNYDEAMKAQANSMQLTLEVQPSNRSQEFNFQRCISTTSSLTQQLKKRSSLLTATNYAKKVERARSKVMNNPRPFFS